MRDEDFLQRCEQVSDSLKHVTDPPSGPGKFFGTIDEVNNLEREFVKAMAEGDLANPVIVASRLVLLGNQADALSA